MPAESGGTVELRLDPEELGHVRLTLHQRENTISISLLAERGETMDLMRRHIDILTQDFRRLGFDDIRFSFGAQDQRQNGAGARPEARTDSTPNDGPDVLTLPAAERAAATIASDGLDIRL